MNFRKIADTNFKKGITDFITPFLWIGSKSTDSNLLLILNNFIFCHIVHELPQSR